MAPLFLLNVLPDHLLKEIIEKIYFVQFFRLFRTAKWIQNLIEENKSSLKATLMWHAPYFRENLLCHYELFHSHMTTCIPMDQLDYIKFCGTLYVNSNIRLKDLPQLAEIFKRNHCKWLGARHVDQDMFIEAVDLIKPYGITVIDRGDGHRYDSRITHSGAFNTAQEIIIVSKTLLYLNYLFLERPHLKVFLTLQLHSNDINRILKLARRGKINTQELVIYEYNCKWFDQHEMFSGIPYTFVWSLDSHPNSRFLDLPVKHISTKCYDWSKIFMLTLDDGSVMGVAMLDRYKVFLKKFSNREEMDKEVRNNTKSIFWSTPSEDC